MSQPDTRNYPVILNDADDANGIASVIATLLTQNFEAFPDRIALASSITRPITISASDIDNTCTINCGPRDVTIFNDHVGEPAVTVTATVEQILDLSQLRMKAHGLLPIGFLTKPGLHILAAIATGNLRVQGLITHPITTFRVIALLSVVS